nr:sulfurtransferase [Nocardioides flavescens]
MISAGDLIELTDRGEVTVLDVRYRMGGPPGAEEHAVGHVPGAAYVDLGRDLAGPPGERGRHPLPDPEAFGEAMRAAGVRRDRTVVVYDDWSGHAAGRAWWLLRHHGHPAVHVLDGGWPAWKAAGGAVATGAVTVEPGDFEPQPGAMPVVDADTLQRADVVVDARAPERFRGEVEPVDPVAGHVPGAVNVPTSTNLAADGRFRSPDQLRALYAAAGVPVDAAAAGDAEVAVYCGSGVTATHDLIALELIGVRAALYPGSWSEWVADGSRPVERS